MNDALLKNEEMESYYDECRMAGLVGAKIQEIRLEKCNANNNDAGEDLITFITDKGPISYYVDGDCCSVSWFADVFHPEVLLGHVVNKAETIEMPAPQDKRTRSEVDQNYGIKLYTNKGICDIVYRNSSNGYYGGQLHPSEKHCTDYNLITKDWSSQ